MFNPFNLIKNLTTVKSSSETLRSALPRVKYKRVSEGTFGDKKVYRWDRLDPDSTEFTHVSSTMQGTTDHAPFLPILPEHSEKIYTIDHLDRKYIVIDHSFTRSQYIALIGALASAGLIDESHAKNFGKFGNTRAKVASDDYNYGDKK